MAVTKIRKISSTTLLVMAAILVVVLVVFLFGGTNPPLNGKMLYPKQTDLLLYWMYIMFGVTVAVALIFVIVQFANSFRAHPKKALGGLLVLVAFAALLIITYAIGDGTPMPELNKDATVAYNTSGWLKVADMMIYSIYAMFALTILAIIWGVARGAFRKS
ncbi:MAG: hypothetical protein LBL81_01800 [Tannerella sp.]|jgi:hypothetical protein|nr:hypothetical protein [Tannerella sp.]